jgi:hypothetical protein
MTLSPVERMVDSFVAYVKAELPLRLIQANAGKAVAAPALKKIEKTVKLNIQYFPCAGINLDSAVFEEAGPGALRVEVRIDLFVCASDSKPERLSAFLERYMDAAVDLASGDPTMGGSMFNLSVTSADKGMAADGEQGWSAVQFVVVGEVDY